MLKRAYVISLYLISGGILLSSVTRNYEYSSFTFGYVYDRSLLQYIQKIFFGLRSERDNKPPKSIANSIDVETKSQYLPAQ